MFNSRVDASKYYNKNIARLEPERKDNWQVYTNESGTHTDWIAPDGTKLFSYSSAVAYAKSSSQPLLGKDGITKKIKNFFVAGAQKYNTSHDAMPVRGREAQATTSKPKPTQDKDISEPTKAKRRVFNVPKQTDSGVKLQQLCRKHAATRVKEIKTKVEEQIVLYTKPRSIKINMANKVIANIYISLQCVYC